MTNSKEREFKEVLWTKIILYTIIISISFVLIVLLPKKVFDKSTPYEIATSIAIIESNNLLLYDYEVYSTDERFQLGLIDDVAIVVDEFKTRNELLVVKINDSTSNVEIKEDHLIITDPSIPHLNIEYHLVRDVNISEIRIPARTFISLANDIITLINNLYLILFFLLFVTILTPISVKLSKVIVDLKRQNFKTQEKE